MKNWFSSIRFSYIRSHLYTLFMVTVILLAFFLTVHVLFDPNWLTATGIFSFILAYTLIGLIVAIYSGYRAGGYLKMQIDGISVLVTQFANGNYESSIYSKENNELARLSLELNELGGKFQQQVESLQRLADENAEFTKSAHKAAVIEERQRLARDLHDAVSQQLFALTMMSEAALKQFDRHPDMAKSQLEEVTAAGQQAQTEMRALLLHLRPVYLSGDPLPVGIHKLVEELKQKCYINFHLKIEEDLGLPESTEEHLFRIIQEALSNILRHANASNAKVVIENRQREVYVHIADDGDGFNVREDSTRKTSYGLKTMKERIGEVGGTLNVRSSKGEGTYIDIRIPKSSVLNEGKED
ncbi:Histidine kinase [Lentibacillus sp. JNUCC-1]|uniref:sensor histidine kinase n=1 Tax=Lentibacillus sp. JNUCC-1 TaxID=2654513 RepID=UPI0012E728DD|nr:sensor histidine kinase [Lentibacillus sp. JNUCC-1]MUV36584.1 Histidine kinase [Lentibacillus sp. JNUCC-1]